MEANELTYNANAFTCLHAEANKVTRGQEGVHTMKPRSLCSHERVYTRRQMSLHAMLSRGSELYYTHSQTHLHVGVNEITHGCKCTDVIPCI